MARGYPIDRAFFIAFLLALLFAAALLGLTSLFPPWLPRICLLAFLPLIWIVWRELEPSFRYRRSIRKTGLKAIYPRQESTELREIFQIAEEGDEILVVARTLSRLLANNDQEIKRALERGVTLKLLLLNKSVLAASSPSKRLDLRSLRLRDASDTIRRDLKDSEDKLKDLRGNAKSDGAKGRLLVYRADFLVQSSVVIHLPYRKNAPMRLLLDFSFGDNKDTDKFVQFYRVPRPRDADLRLAANGTLGALLSGPCTAPQKVAANAQNLRADAQGSFCERLYRFYEEMADGEEAWFAYDLSYLPESSKEQLKALEVVGAKRIRRVIDAHEEREAIRENSLAQIVPAAHDVFKALSCGERTPPPISVQMELTNKCSTRCGHCDRWRTSDIGDMEESLARQLLDEFAEIGVQTVTLSGGEPTQHPQFNQLLAYANSRKLAVGVLSNGVGLSDETIEAIHENARWLRLSIDGSGAAVYATVRHSLTGINPYDAVRRTIKQFRTLGGKSCRLAICYTIQANNVHDVPGMIRWLDNDLGISADDALVFKFAHGAGGFLCTRAQLEDFERKVLDDPEFKDRANLPYISKFMRERSTIHDLAEGRPTETLYLQWPTRCFTPYLFSLVGPQGDVYPCCFLFEDNSGYTKLVREERQKHCLGTVTVNGQSFNKIWEGSKYKRLRNELAVINPAEERFNACGECTRHCNHNRWLTQIYTEYEGLMCEGAGTDAEAVLNYVGAGKPRRPVWL